MSSVKCPHCRLNNFPGTPECRRCNQSLGGAPALALPVQAVAAYHAPAATAVMPGVKERRVAPHALILALAIAAIAVAIGGVYGPTRVDVLKSYVYTVEAGILALFLCGLAFTIWGPSKRPLNELDRDWETRPSRIDGCLVIPAAAVMLNVLLRALAFNEGLQVLPKLQPLTVIRKSGSAELDLSGLLSAEMAANGLIVIVSLMLLGDYFGRHERLPGFIIGLFVVEVVWGIIDVALGVHLTSGALVMTRTGLKPLSDLVDQQGGSMGLLFLLIFLINRAVCVFYFMLWKRVKATFAPADDF